MDFGRGTAVALLLAASCLGACHPVVRRDHAWLGRMWRDNADKPLAVAASLVCPETQGDLKRVSVASDGRSCAYRGDGDQDVSLRLVSLEGKPPQEALAPEEASLRGLVPVNPGAVGVSTDGRSARADADDEDGGRTTINLPGVHISTHGGRADVRILGTDITADGDRADIHTDLGAKGTTIRAGPGGAEIRTGSVGRNAAQLIYILAADNPGPSGYRAVGLLARGPVAGPLVVGEFRSKSAREAHGDNDLQRLIDRNVTAQGGEAD